MLEKLNPQFRILDRGAPRKSVGASFPTELAELYAEASTLAVEGPEGRYFDIWSPEEVDEMNQAYGVSSVLPDAVPVGTDGGGTLIIIRSGRVYAVGAGALAESECWLLAGSLGLFLENPEPLWRWL